jgi:diguanylate cyclase (GGDEF)-like protein
VTERGFTLPPPVARFWVTNPKKCLPCRREKLHPDDADRVTRIMRSILDGSVDRQSVINRTRHGDQHWVWVEAQFRVLKDPKTGERIGIIGALRDISVRKAVEDKLAEATRQLEALAREDGLTGLPNRRAFDDALSTEYRRAQRNKKSLGLIMLDVDWFKSFNDRYGHPAGDDCLRQIGRAIKNTVFRPGDIAARYGGEEFVVLLPDTDEAGAALIGERIRQAVSLLAIPHESSRYGVVTIRVGNASFGRDTRQRKSEMLLEYATERFSAKGDGRNLVIRASALFMSPTEESSTAA